MRKPLFLLTAATLALAACSDGEPSTAPESEASQEGMAGMDSMEGMTPAQQAYMRAMTEMHEAMGAPAADPDLAFMQGMREHHRGAIAMSEVILQYGADEEAKALARQVIEEQSAELAEIDAWLAANAGGVSTGTAAAADASAGNTSPPPARSISVPQAARSQGAAAPSTPTPTPSETPEGDAHMMDHSGMDHGGN
ncbi:DUF305 domain-containing protein [Erythrobacter arachoides]|uniref:DUF305 domain-containing protein n=1 Tax=Aurantiacibacter arachoides TaxID=1850444 RepID=A0A845A782_9SPHN|nr:DUF305 domain-containing protein [Aurantiacibacter arachoides]MXO94777.1 DUF305 domain-containing protein [Aurantiacibacter arachoides]GGD60784.1 hypothetical protein GCM10011411_21240 [Aurantiacibacter arachoides]